MDWGRAGYYLFMWHTGLADTYRNEQYIGKPDWLYERERQLILINFNNPDKGKLALNLLKCLKFDYKALIDYADSYHQPENGNEDGEDD